MPFVLLLSFPCFLFFFLRNWLFLCSKVAVSIENNIRILGSRTLCFSLSSLLNGALMMTRRSLEGALKCALRDFRREEASSVDKINCQSLIDIRNNTLNKVQSSVNSAAPINQAGKKQLYAPPLTFAICADLKGKMRSGSEREWEEVGLFNYRRRWESSAVKISDPKIVWETVGQLTWSRAG